MYNLICFPHYTCGGLLCDILSDTFSAPGPAGDIQSIQHNLGKIGDTDTVLTEYNSDHIMAQLATLTDKSVWVGTHCWPGQLPLHEFNQIICITTATYRSQIYRWMRTYQHYFLPRWQDLAGMELTDKMRESAKNYLIPFDPVYHTRVYNVEFADIVENTAEFHHLIGTRDITAHVDRWQKINNFLYDKDLWNSPAAVSFYQAQAEYTTKRYYVYKHSGSSIV